MKHLGKIASVRNNAKKVLEIQTEYGSLSNFIWNYVEGNPVINNWTELSQLPAKTELSDQFSKDLKKRGFKFVGSVTMYSFMQAVGMVDDHIITCFKHTK
ncbi:DNA-3-methyladenine glycosylase 1 [compost metagenome]